MIYVCANCQAEIPEVKEAIRKAEKDRPDLSISHGICKRHAAVWYKSMGKTDDWIKTKLSQTPSQTPDLKEHPEIVKQYTQGVFTPADYKKAQSVTPTDNIKEFFRKRAGLIS